MGGALLWLSFTVIAQFGNGNKFDPVYGATDLTLNVVPE
jgi:hypothetical protein